VPTHYTAKIMKDGIHPNYREVVFLDTSCDFGFVTRSTVATNETIKWKDGKEYPVYKIEISAESHPFYTGKQKIVDTAGRVDKFKKRYARKGTAAKAAE
jgi:large subunit ribosomal protein L31